MPERLVKADLLWAATTPLILRYWSSSLVMRWRLLSTGQKPVEERQEDVLGNIGGTGQYGTGTGMEVLGNIGRG